MRRREGALTADAHSRDGRSRSRVVRRPLRAGQPEANIEKEILPGGGGTHPQREPLASVTGPVMLSARACACQPPEKLRSVTLSPPQPLSTKLVIAAVTIEASTDGCMPPISFPPLPLPKQKSVRLRG